MRMIAGAVVCLLLVGLADDVLAQGPPSQAPLPNSAINPPRTLTPFTNQANNPTQDYGYDDPGAAPEERTGPLDDEERAALARGEYTMGERVGGAVAAGLLGFGSGQAIQGRWSQRGWIFTAGEPAALAVGIVGLATCPDDGCSGVSQAMALTGILGFCILRAWGFADSILVPGTHNKRLPRLRMRDEQANRKRSLAPYVVPASQGDGATVGLSLRF